MHVAGCETLHPVLRCYDLRRSTAEYLDLLSVGQFRRCCKNMSELKLSSRQQEERYKLNHIAFETQNTAEMRSVDNSKPPLFYFSLKIGMMPMKSGDDSTSDMRDDMWILRNGIDSGRSRTYLCVWMAIRDSFAVRIDGGLSVSAEAMW